MSKITKLTVEQEADLVAYRAEMLQVGLDCTPADRAAAERAWRAMCDEVKQPMRPVLWFSSPAVCALAILEVAIAKLIIEKGPELGSQLDSQLDSQLGSQLGSQLYSQLYSQLDLQLRSQLGSQLYSQLGSQLYSQLDSQLRSQLSSQLHSQLRSQLYSQLDSQLDSQLGSQLDSQLDSQLYSQLHSQLRSQLYSQLRSQLDSQLYSQLHSQLRSQLDSQLYSQLDSQLHSQLHSQLDSQLYSQLGSQLRSQLSSQLYSQLDSQLAWRLASWRWWGQMETAWVAWALFPLRIGVTYPPDVERRLRLWETLCRSANWWWACEDFTIASERYEHVSFDEQARLHNETGMAVRYRDGWGVHCWHGVQVPAAVIEAPETLTAEQILAEENVEVRRVMVERVGYDRLLEKAERLQQDDYGVLWRINQADDELIVLVQVVDPSTGREYMLRVPPDRRSARSAVAWTFGVDGRSYAPAVEA